MVNSAINDILLKFQLMKDEIQLMKLDIQELQDSVSKLQDSVSKLDIKMGKFYDLIDSVMGDFKKFGEEQDILSYRVSDHTDKLEKLEEKVFGVASA